MHFIFWLGFFLVGLGLEHNATPRPRIDRNVHAGPPQHRVAVRQYDVFWLALAFVQWLWNYLIYQRFVSEPEAQSFLDVARSRKYID